MIMKEEIKMQKLLHAPLQKVWSAITDKEEMKAWYFDLAEFRPEIGFQFSFTGGPEGGPVYVHLCEVTEVIAQKKLTYSWKYEGFPGISWVTFDLEPQGENTLLTLTHIGLESIAPSGPDFALKNFKEGWNHFVNNALPAYVEQSQLHV
jgi:uncharacterized protein YndB with AHSA1/START domain